MAGNIRAGILATSMTFAVMTLPAMAPAGAASPDAPKEDVFGRTTGTPPGPHAPPHGRVSGSTIHIGPSAPAPNSPHPIVSTGSAPQQWFDAFDDYVAAYKPTPSDELNMNKPFNQEVERVTLFCNTVAKVARNYKILAQKLQSLPIPNQAPETKEYRNQMVTWYSDSAGVYDDMVRPRPAARTKEELNAMIKDLNDRSENLKANFETLAKMDSDIRLQYHVNPPKQDDPLRKYAGHH
jgi:hypothetical protein